MGYCKKEYCHCRELFTQWNNSRFDLNEECKNRKAKTISNRLIFNALLYFQVLSCRLVYCWYKLSFLPQIIGKNLFFYSLYFTLISTLPGMPSTFCGFLFFWLFFGECFAYAYAVVVVYVCFFVVIVVVNTNPFWIIYTKTVCWI